MNTAARPIKPTPHAIMDYGLVAFLLAAPFLFNLPDNAKYICYAFGVMEFIFVAVSAHRATIVPLIPMRLHGLLEYPILGAFLLVAWATGAMNDPTARWLFLGITAVALVLHFLTDYNGGVVRAGATSPAGRR